MSRVSVLPESALMYFKDKRAKQVTVTAVTSVEVERFFAQPFRKVLPPRHAAPYRRALRGYLRWLYDSGRLEFDPATIDLGKQTRSAVLPALAADFLQSLKPTLKTSTLHQYQTTLRHFYSWLDDAKLSVRRLRRSHMEQWFLFLSDRRLHAATRIHLILQIRAYFRWLGERGELREHADSLVRRSDLPKLPQYLPRPLPPEINRALQLRLSTSPDPLQRALLLMRQTGLRIGELLNLTADCVRADSLGNRFLKVPLGKLDTERLVPISPDTHALIVFLVSASPLPRTFLLETEHGRRVSYAQATVVLQTACVGLGDAEPITTHRLRHTYATELLSAGMSLVGVMKLLGHRDYRMTLRYAAVTQEHVGREYHRAFQEMKQRYAVKDVVSSTAFEPARALDELIAWMQNHLAHRGHNQSKVARNISKRLGRIKSEIDPIL